MNQLVVGMRVVSMSLSIYAAFKPEIHSWTKNQIRKRKIKRMVKAYGEGI